MLGDVRDLVAQHAGQLVPITIHHPQQIVRDVDRTAGQRESIDTLHVDHTEPVRKVGRVAGRGHGLADVTDRKVLPGPVLAIDLGGRLLAEADLVLAAQVARSAARRQQGRGRQAENCLENNS
jgi:hypothetical protein